ncbi:MAG: ERF family protein [Azonexus sp.]
MKQISAALVKAQKAFGPALKSSTNPHFKSRYADLSACVEAVIEGLNDNGIMLMQPCHESESGVTVETLFIHKSGEQMSAGKLHVPAAKNDPQGYGSALTYARRYSLMAACGIAPEDDDGNAGSKPAPKREPVTLTDNTVADFLTTISDAKDMDALKKAFSVAYKAAEHVSDAKAQAKFEQAKDQRKTAIQNEITSQA